MSKLNFICNLNFPFTCNLTFTGSRDWDIDIFGGPLPCLPQQLLQKDSLVSSLQEPENIGEACIFTTSDASVPEGTLTVTTCFSLLRRDALIHLSGKFGKNKLGMGGSESPSASWKWGAYGKCSFHCTSRDGEQALDGELGDAHRKPGLPFMGGGWVGKPANSVLQCQHGHLANRSKATSSSLASVSNKGDILAPFPNSFAFFLKLFRARCKRGAPLFSLHHRPQEEALNWQDVIYCPRMSYSCTTIVWEQSWCGKHSSTVVRSVYVILRIPRFTCWLHPIKYCVVLGEVLNLFVPPLTSRVFGSSSEIIKVKYLAQCLVWRKHSVAS